jgi:uncharacterized protein (DUF3820 family)
MNSSLIAPTIGIISGSAAYFITTFWLQPILKYREIKQRILSDLIFYADAISNKVISAEQQSRVNERSDANRRASADLAACTLLLPNWFLYWLLRRKECPRGAVEELMELSKDFDYPSAERRVAKIKSCLRLPS